MKCKKCNQEMRFGQEACGTDINGNPIFKDFAYCDNCRIRVEIQQTPPVQPTNNGFQSAGVQNINNVPKKKKHGCLWSIIIFFLVCALLYQCGNSDKDSDTKNTNSTSVSNKVTNTPAVKKDSQKSKTNSKPKQEAKSKQKAKPKKTAKAKPTLSPKQIKAKEKKAAKAKKAKFINACKTYNYKKVMRNPNKYVGKKIKLKCQINQISEDGLFTQGFLRCYSYSGYDIYADDEYVVFDERAAKTPKLLSNDIITVYGTIEKPEVMTRALTGTKDTVFTIKMKYVKIHN